METVLVYMTAETPEEARRIAAALVDERLAACVNILPPITAVFRWGGRVQTGGETAFIAKTTSGRFAALEKRVVELHSYEVPCVVALPVSDGHTPFLQWVGEEVSG